MGMAEDEGSAPPVGEAGRPAAALPQLRGPALRIFGTLWLAALAVAAVAPLGGAWLRIGRVAGTMDAISLAIDLVPPVLLVATAIMLFLGRRNDSVVALLSLSFLLMSASFFASEGFFRALGLTWLRDPLAHLGRAALIVVLLTFPDGRFVPRWTVAVALLLALWTPFAWLGPVSLDQEYLGYLAFTAIGVLSMALPYRRLPLGLERQQVRWALFGFATGTILLVLATAISLLPDVRPGAGAASKTWAELAAQSLAALGIAGFTLGLLVSLLRYRLYDADAVISRSAGYAVLTLTLGAVFAASAKGVELFFEASFGRDSGAVPAAVAAGLAAVLITPAHNRIHGWAERRFQKGLLHLRRDLPACVNDLRETAALGELLDEVLERIATGVRAARAAVLLGDSAAAVRGGDPDEVDRWLGGRSLEAPPAGLDCDRSDPLFPMRVPLRVRHGGDRPIGWILLGPRPDGSFYGKDEREALAEIADPVARAVQIVELRERRGREREARLAALERELGRIARAIEAAPDRP
jgi:hypothetical protein